MLPFAAFVIALGCATGSAPVPQYEQLPGVSIVFDHFGQAANPLDQRMLEDGHIAAAHASGNDSWFRLRNDSSDVITFSTYSMYAPKHGLEWIEIRKGTRELAVPDGAEVALPFGVEAASGRPVDVYSAIDMYWKSNLPPGRSVVFSVPHRLLKKNRRVFVTFMKAAEERGATYRVYSTPSGGS